MAQAAYGKTWWGGQWLNALTHIDFENRLPRGRRYANQGAVRNLAIDGGRIEAKVAGTRPTPYKVSITVPPLSAKHGKQLVDAIAADPVLVARMLNRELDPAVLELARRLGIAVFPERWNDLKMSCSCPDWAVPCKHLAAVVYVLSREIDGDPFRVFSLRGLDLVGELEARGLQLAGAQKLQLPSWQSLLPVELKYEVPAAEQAPQDTDPLAALEAIDYARLPDLADALAGVLPARPAFFAGTDLRETYRRVLARIAKASRAELLTNADADAAKAGSTRLHTGDRPQIGLTAELVPEVTGTASPCHLPDLLAALGEVPAARLPDHQPETAVLWQLRLLALQLLARGAVVPQLFEVKPGVVGLRWLPATLEPAVAELMAAVTTALPPGLVPVRKGRQRRTLARAAQAEFLVSLFLGEFVRSWSQVGSEKPLGDPTLRLFFGTGRAVFDGPGEGAMAAGIHGWLARFHLAQRDYAPLLWLEEGGDGDFDLGLAVKPAADPLAAPVPLAAVLQEPGWAPSRMAVLQTVSLLAEFLPALNGYVSAGAAEPLTVDSKALPGLLFDTLPILRLLGIQTILPRALDRLLRPRLSIRVHAGAADGSPGLLKFRDMLWFDWALVVGDQPISRAEFARLMQSAGRVVQFKGAYVYLDPAELEKLQAQLEDPPELADAELLRVAVTGEYAGTPVALDAAVRERVRQLQDAGEPPLPAGLQATLRPYQQRGYAWLYRNAQLGFGSVIADDMGLGKTLQVITTLLKLKEEGALADGKVLVIVPTSLLTNWQKEIARFAPALSVDVFHGAKRELKAERPDVLLTTYGIARTAAAALKALRWRLVVIDEAQNIKNAGAAQTKAAKAIPADSFIAMSGTPVENRLAEYWSIMDFANRGYLGNLKAFGREYAVPIQSQHDQQALQRFKRATAPFLLRRLKSDKSIITDLPDKIEQDQYCQLTPEQAALYEAVVQEGLRAIEGESQAFQRDGLVLQLVLALKQVCNHPAQFLKETGGDPLLSGKMERCFELLDAIHASHEKALVFTQFTAMGELLGPWLQQRYGRAPQFLHGGVSRPQRDAMVERFQQDRTERIFLLSLKAGGTGLNLTAASHVIHFDLWWNPAVEAQATDRAYRIGQQRNVQVHRMITRNTFEERINDMLQKKRSLADLAVDAGETWIGNLSNAELRELFLLK